MPAQSATESSQPQPQLPPALLAQPEAPLLTLQPRLPGTLLLLEVPLTGSPTSLLVARRPRTTLSQPRLHALLPSQVSPSPQAQELLSAQIHSATPAQLAQSRLPAQTTLVCLALPPHSPLSSLQASLRPSSRQAQALLPQSGTGTTLVPASLRPSPQVQSLQSPASQALMFCSQLLQAVQAATTQTSES
jgi:hypothetical protein